MVESSTGSTFLVRCGVDYPGDDVDNVQASTPDICLELCDTRGEICGGVTFTAGSPGTCWLKTTMPDSDAVSSDGSISLIRASTGADYSSPFLPVCDGSLPNIDTYSSADGT